MPRVTLRTLAVELDGFLRDLAFLEERHALTVSQQRLKSALVSEIVALEAKIAAFSARAGEHKVRPELARSPTA